MATIKKDYLFAAVKRVTPGVDNKPADGGGDTSCLVFMDDKVITCNNSVAVQAACDIGGMQFAIRADEFHKLLAKSTGTDVELEINGNLLKYKCGKLKSELLMAEVDKTAVGNVRTGEGNRKPVPDNFGEALLTTHIAKNKETSSGFAFCKFDDGWHVCACDGIRFTDTKLNGSMDEVLVPAEALLNALTIGTPIAYAVDGPWFTVELDNGVVYSIAYSNFSNFPHADVNKYITMYKQSTPVMSGKLPKGTGDAASRVAVLASTSDVMPIPFITMELTDEGVTVRGEREMRGNAEELVDWEEDCIDGAVTPISVNVPVAFLAEAVKKTANFKVVVPNPNVNIAVILFEGEGYVQCLSANVI